jgi:hypothetical protein
MLGISRVFSYELVARRAAEICSPRRLVMNGLAIGERGRDASHRVRRTWVLGAHCPGVRIGPTCGSAQVEWSGRTHKEERMTGHPAARSGDQGLRSIEAGPEWASERADVPGTISEANWSRTWTRSG